MQDWSEENAFCFVLTTVQVIDSLIQMYFHIRKCHNTVLWQIFKARYSTGISKTINKLFIFLHSNLRFLFLNAYTRFGMHLHYKWNTCFVVQIKLFFKPAKKCISQTNEKSINEYAHIQIIIAFTVNIKRNRAYLCKECYIPKFKTLETQYWRKP